MPSAPTSESEISPAGSLYASGLIAAGGIIGLLGISITVVHDYEERRGKIFTFPHFSPHNPLHHDWISVVAFAALAFSLYYFARKPLDTNN